MINYTQNTEGYQMIDALNRITCNRKRSTGSVKGYELRHTNRIRTAQQNIHMISIRAEGEQLHAVHMQQDQAIFGTGSIQMYSEDVYEVYEEDDERTQRVHSVQYENEHEDEEQEERYINQEMGH
eukprot:434596_1